MKNLIAITCFVLPLLGLAQDRPSLHGKAISDETTVEFLIVKNLTTNATANGNESGSFIINAKEGDVLEFSCITFTTVTHTLSAKDIKEELFVVRLVPSAILLDEIALSGLTGSLYIDSKNTDVLLLNDKFKDDFDAAALNLGRVNNNPNMNLDFISILGAVAGAVYSAMSPESSHSKPSGGKAAYRPSSVEQISFSKILRESYPESFFTDTIKIPRERLALFLISCNDTAKRYLIDPKNEQELIAYLKERYSKFIIQYEANEN
ncbi:peptidase associated/transthyretin-like domain-containing protein [Flavobacterium hauense]